MDTRSNPGCLASLLRLLGVSPKPPSDEVTKKTEYSGSDLFPYRLRDDFLSPTEQNFYLVLKSMMGNYLTICPKVSLADIFFVIRPNDNVGAYNRINRKHIDFLLCNPKTMKPQFAIELDDNSHQRSDREERDDFVNSVFEAANLPLLHIPARNSYNTSELGVLFRQTLKMDHSIQETKNVTSEVDTLSYSAKQTLDSTPICPKCGVSMVLRIAHKGNLAGKQFFGCPNYPKCRVVINV